MEECMAACDFNQEDMDLYCELRQTIRTAGGFSSETHWCTPREPAVPNMVFIMPVEKKISTCQSTKVSLSEWELVFTPRTDLGKRLYALRTKAVVSGIRLLSEEEVLDEVKRRRGELEEDEKDLY